jgi:hypothetical protein
MVAYFIIFLTLFASASYGLSNDNPETKSEDQR